MDKKNMFSLEGKITLVTGGAHGIGFAIAESYAEAGATVVFNCSNEESLKRGLAAYKEKGIDAHGYVCDVTDEEAVKKMIADIEEKIGTVDILVNNAGMIRRIPMHEMSAEEFRKVVDVDLNAPFIMAKAVLPSMMQDHHHLLHDVRTRKRDCIRICGCKGRIKDAHKEHRLRVRRIQHPVQRHRTWLYRDIPDGAAKRAPGGRLPPPV